MKDKSITPYVGQAHREPPSEYVCILATPGSSWPVLRGWVIPKRPSGLEVTEQEVKHRSATVKHDVMAQPDVVEEVEVDPQKFRRRA